MKGVYGSKAEPKNIFGEGELLDLFYDACFTEAPGAYGLLDTLTQAWQPNVLLHKWTMPDAFDVRVKVMQTKETRIEVDELNHHQFLCNYKVNEGTPFGVSLVANVTHSIDAFLLRSVIRRASINRNMVKKVLSLIENSPTNNTYKPCESLDKLMKATATTNFVDPVWFNLIDKFNVVNLPEALKYRLTLLGKKILSHKAYDLLTVHDAFRQHANNCQYTRYWYAETMAELSESNILQSIVNEITGDQRVFNKYSRDLPSLIRGSNYAIC